MSTGETLAQKTSIHTLFGQLRYLGKVTDKLYKNNVCRGRDLENLTEEEFSKIIGDRTSPSVKRTIKARMSEMDLHFRPR